MSTLAKLLDGAKLVKAHVKGYYRRDGTWVADHEDKRLKMAWPGAKEAKRVGAPGTTPAQPPKPSPAQQEASKPPGWFQQKFGMAKPASSPSSKPSGGSGVTAPQYGLFGGGKSHYGSEPKPKPEPKAWHPELDEKGKKVPIYDPHKPTSADTWAHGDKVAVLTPHGGELPSQLNGVAFSPWADAPTNEEDWEEVDGQDLDSEPPFHCPHDLEPAAGVVVREPDGRFWMVAPTNGFGGSPHVFPKGRTEGMAMQASAIKEAFEECGLKVRIVEHLGDFDRTMTRTRYYLAERVGGTPAKMGWESQAALLVPKAELPKYLTGGANAGVLAALMKKT